MSNCYLCNILRNKIANFYVNYVINKILNRFIDKESKRKKDQKFMIEKRNRNNKNNLK